MKKKIGVVGFRGKFGRLLLERPNFVPIDCDVLDLESISQALPNFSELDLLIDLEEITEVVDWHSSYSKAIKINVRGLYNLHKVFGERVVNISPSDVMNVRKRNESPYLFTKLGSESVSIVSGGTIIRIPEVTEENIVYIINQIAKIVESPKLRKLYTIRLGFGYWTEKVFGK